MIQIRSCIACKRKTNKKELIRIVYKDNRVVFDKLQKDEGNLTYKNKIFDEIFNLTSDILEKEAQYEIK